jgi:hypothetical protein
MCQGPEYPGVNVIVVDHRINVVETVRGFCVDGFHLATSTSRNQWA